MLSRGSILSIACLSASLLGFAQQPDANASGPIIRAETREVMVDAVVTDKKGNYISDLTAKDFKVYEDKKEQKVTTFRKESEPASPNKKERQYMVLFFVNSTLRSPADQVQGRQAALKFIDANVGPDRLMSVVNFGGTLEYTQSFTSDAEQLKKVVNMPRTVSLSMSSFGPWILLGAINDLAKGLANVPGRKAVVLLTGGFLVHLSDDEAYLTAAINACNRSNVALYPVDIHGLVAPFPARSLRGGPESPFRLVSYVPGAAFQVGGGSHGGTGGTGGAGRVGTGGTGGGTTGRGGGGTPGGMGGRSGLATNPNAGNRSLVPSPSNTGPAQQVLYQLAEATGGFVIVNTNDLLSGMERIQKEQSEYYVLGYTPEESSEGSCHLLHVKVDRKDVEVRSRNGYCDTKPQDMLANTPTEKTMEAMVNGAQAGDVGGSMEAAYLFSTGGAARVDVALEFPASNIVFEKQKGKFHSAVNVLGIAYRPDGNVAARFSDTVKVEAENKKEVQEFSAKQFHYEGQFDIGPGQYNLKLVYTTGGTTFGKLTSPLTVDSIEGTPFGLSGVVLSRAIHRVEGESLNLQADILADRKPFVTQGIQITPSGSNHFRKTEQAALYVEIYDPAVTSEKPPDVGLQLRILDGKTGEAKHGSGLGAVSKAIEPGNPVIPVALCLPLDGLQPGPYKLELQAVDSAGHRSTVRTTDIIIE